MTRGEKAAATVRARKQRQRELEAAQRAEREAIHALLLEVVNDSTATYSERLRAAELLTQGN